VLGEATFRFVHGSYAASPTLPLAIFGLGGLLAIVAFIGMFLGSISETGALNLTLAGFGVSLLVVIWQSIINRNQDRDRIFAAMFLILGSILFWALFEQAGSSLNLFTDRHVDRSMLGFEVKASMFQSINVMDVQNNRGTLVPTRGIAAPATDLDEVKKILDVNYLTEGR
jgi:POT family proton-dependent oligopeptide transporter